jgi:hypothetical protein
VFLILPWIKFELRCAWKNRVEKEFHIKKQFRLFFVLFILVTLGLLILLQQTLPTGVSAAQDAAQGDVQLKSLPTDQMYLPIMMRHSVAELPLWRFGAAKFRHSLLDYDPNDMKKLRLGWYMNWTVSDEGEPYGMEYMPMVRVKQWKDNGAGIPVDCCVDCDYLEPYAYKTTPNLATITTFAAAHPGKIWILGNEIERVDFPADSGCAHQDEILPEFYAVAYHDLYTAIKAADPTAQIAIGGVIQATPLRLEYLTRIWDGYQDTYGVEMPVDVWNIHAYILREVAGEWGADIPAGIDATEGIVYAALDNKDFSIAQDHLIAMRQWMKDRGQQNKPLIVTELGVNLPEWVDTEPPNQFTPDHVRDEYMYPAFKFLLNYTDTELGYPADDYHLVQRWSWYSVDDDSGWWEEVEDDVWVYFQNWNGNLFHSGLIFHPVLLDPDPPMGLSEHGLNWIDYVEDLPLGSDPPY